MAGAQYTYRMHKFLFLPAHLTFGMEYNRNNLHDRMLGYDRDMRQMSCTYGGYVQNEWESERLNFVIGARIDKNNRIGNPVFSPRANIRYTPVRNVILRAGYTSGYRAPQAYDEDLHVKRRRRQRIADRSRSRPQAGVLEQLHAVGRSLPQHGQGAAQPASRRILHEPRRRILSRRAGAPTRKAT